MKALLRSIFVNGFALSLLPQLYSGVKISGGLYTLLFGGFILAVLSLVVKPILTIVSFPINMVTFGLFSFVANSLLLYLLSIVVPEIKITQFVFPGYTVAGFVIPKMYINTFFAYILSFATYSLIVSCIEWLFRK